MHEISPRVQRAFAKTKTVCFGRFLIDVPITTTTAWGNTVVWLNVQYYRDGATKVAELSDHFVTALNSEKAIYKGNVPLFVSEEYNVNPNGKIIVGYESFDAMRGLKINGYFNYDGDGLAVYSRPMLEDRDAAVSLIKEIAHRTQPREEGVIPALSGNCIEDAFIADGPSMSEPFSEHIEVGFRIDELPGTHFSIHLAPANAQDTSADSLEASMKRLIASMRTPEEKAVLATTKFLRQARREIRDWKTGYEVLMRTPDETGSRSHHEFSLKFTGVPSDVLRPYADIRMHTGVANNVAGSAITDLTDAEALDIWKLLSNSIRERLIDNGPSQAGAVGSEPLAPLGLLVATGRQCPETGWWQPTGLDGEVEGERRYVKAGETMPHVAIQTKPNIWQRITNSPRPQRSATVWKYVAYNKTGRR